jgi:hypothetical protein
MTTMMIMMIPTLILCGRAVWSCCMPGEEGHALLQRVVDGSSFKKMKQQATEASSSAPRVNTSAHLRKGVRGDSQSHFNRPGCEHLEELFRAVHARDAHSLPVEFAGR